MQLIVTFHGVGEPPVGTDTEALRYWWNEAAFGRVLDAISSAAVAPETPIVITFDDGNESDVRVALPALVQRNLTARFFVCAGRIGLPGFLDKGAIGELLSAGMRVGSHGLNHVDWRRTSDAELKREVHDSKQILQDFCGRRVDEVAVPFGSYSRRVIQEVRKADFSSVFTSDGGFARATNWLRPRNTLDGMSRYLDFMGEIRRRDNVAAHLWRNLSVGYKTWR